MYYLNTLPVKKLARPAQAGAIRHRDAFGTHYGLRLGFYTEGSLDGIKTLAVNPCAPSIK